VLAKIRKRPVFLSLVRIHLVGFIWLQARRKAQSRLGTLA